MWDWTKVECVGSFKHLTIASVVNEDCSIESEVVEKVQQSRRSNIYGWQYKYKYGSEENIAW